MSESEVDSPAFVAWLATVNWPKRVDPDDPKKILLFQFIETCGWVEVCFHSYVGADARMKHLQAWKKVWKHGLGYAMLI